MLTLPHHRARLLQITFRPRPFAPTLQNKRLREGACPSDRPGGVDPREPAPLDLVLPGARRSRAARSREAPPSWSRCSSPGRHTRARPRRAPIGRIRRRAGADSVRRVAYFPTRTGECAEVGDCARALVDGFSRRTPARPRRMRPEREGPGRGGEVQAL